MIFLSALERGLPFNLGSKLSLGYQDYKFGRQRGDFYFLFEPYLGYERGKGLHLSISGNGFLYYYFITSSERFLGNIQMDVKYPVKNLIFHAGNSFSTLSKDIMKPEELFPNLTIRNSVYGGMEWKVRTGKRYLISGRVKGGYNYYPLENIDYFFSELEGEGESFIARYMRGGIGAMVRYFGLGDWTRFSPFLFLRISFFRLKTEIRGGYNFLLGREKEGFMGDVYCEYKWGGKGVVANLYVTNGEDLYGRRYRTGGGETRIILNPGKRVRIGVKGAFFRLKFEDEPSRGYLYSGAEIRYVLKIFEIFATGAYFHPVDGGEAFSDVRIGLNWGI